MVANQEVKQPQFYKKVIALSQDGHRSWKIQLKEDYQFASETNAVLVTAVEFSLVSAEYPIVFVKASDEKTLSPVAVLGLEPQQNLYLTNENKWDATYIPAYIRRYPYILSSTTEQSSADATYTVCLDEAYKGFNIENGEPLFKDSGEHSTYLENVVNFLKDYQSQGIATENFCKTIQKLGLLEPMHANMKGLSGDDIKLTGFMAVNTDKLKALKPLLLAELVKSDEMGLIYYHLSSLKNFSRLTQKYAEIKQQQP